MLDFKFQFPFQKRGLKLQSIYKCCIDFYKIVLTFIVEGRESTSSAEELCPVSATTKKKKKANFYLLIRGLWDVCAKCEVNGYKLK